MRIHTGIAVLGLSALLSFALPLAGTKADDNKNDKKSTDDLVSLGQTILKGPVLAPVKIPFLNPNQLITKGDPADIVAIDQLFALYGFYHDTSDGERLASLFTEDGIFEDLFNNFGTLQPNRGTGGLGCILRGRAQIARFIFDETASNPKYPTSVPVQAHHIITSKLIRVDGDNATLYGTFFEATNNPVTGAVSVGSVGEYITDFVRAPGTPNGWLISHDRPILDFAGASTVCDLFGPIPR
jgi:SnoaL-like domain